MTASQRVVFVKCSSRNTPFTRMRFKPRFSAVLRNTFVGARLRLSRGRFTCRLRSMRLPRRLRRIFAVSRNYLVLGISAKAI